MSAPRQTMRTAGSTFDHPLEHDKAEEDEEESPRSKTRQVVILGPQRLKILSSLSYCCPRSRRETLTSTVNPSRTLSRMMTLDDRDCNESPSMKSNDEDPIDGMVSLGKYLASQLHRTSGRYTLLMEAAVQGKLLLLLDGLDEMGSRQRHRLERWLLTHHGFVEATSCRLISSYRSGYGGNAWRLYRGRRSPSPCKLVSRKGSSDDRISKRKFERTLRRAPTLKWRQIHCSWCLFAYCSREAPS